MRKRRSAVSSSSAGRPSHRGWRPDSKSKHDALQLTAAAILGRQEGCPDLQIALNVDS